MTAPALEHARLAPSALVQRVRVWQRAQALWWMVVFAMLVATGTHPAWLPSAAAGVAVASYLVLFAAISAWRLADALTLTRMLGLAAVVSAAGLSGGIAVWQWFVAVAAVAADLIDGPVARRCGSTRAGEVLDMEADQTATLGLAVLAVVPCGAGTWPLALPAFRHAFVLASWHLDLPAHDPKPVAAGDNRRARRICAAVMVLQLAAIAPWLGTSGRAACLAAAVAALAYSYASDLVFLVRARSHSHPRCR